jgi:hypothetical protein
MPYSVTYVVAEQRTNKVASKLVEIIDAKLFAKYNVNTL